MEEKTIDKFFLLLWKNWIVQIRHFLDFLLVICFPFIMLLAFYIITRSFESKEFQRVSYTPYDPAGKNLSEIELIVYTPKTPVTQQIINYITKVGSPQQVSSENDSQELEYYLSDHKATKKVGIIFGSGFESTVPTQIDITLRFPAEFGNEHHYQWHINELFPVNTFATPRARNITTTVDPAYFQSSFLTFQKLIADAIFNIVEQNDTEHDYKIELSRFPYPSYKSEPAVVKLANMGFFFIFGLIFATAIFIKNITMEKQLHLKEVLQIMGVSSALNWSAWFVKCLTLLMLIIIIELVILKVGKIFVLASSLVLFFFFMLHSCALVTFCFAVSTFFKNATIAAIVGSLIYLLMMVPFFIESEDLEKMPPIMKVIAMFFCNYAFLYGFRIISILESTSGVQFKNIWQPATFADNVSMGYILVFLIIDTIIYLLIALYVEAIWPGPFRMPKRWHFIFKLFKRYPEKDEIIIGSSPSVIRLTPDNFEDEPTGTKLCLSALHLRKLLHGDTIVNDFTLNLYQNQIITVLGHKGSGKTVAVLLLCGMYVPTGGKILVDGKEVTNRVDNASNSIGVCFEANVLYNELTVYEHLYFVSCLKGLAGDEIKREIEKFISLLDFDSLRKRKIDSLPYSLKRKFSVALAFCGKSKIVILDEPTEGMNMQEKQKLWMMIQQEKKKRAILLMSNMMDEANVLSDRIGFMVRGTLECLGTPTFIKRKFGAGYHLIIDKGVNFNSEKTLEFLTQFIPTIAIEQELPTVVAYLLPAHQSSKYAVLLENLDNNLENLDISYYDIQLSRLEEVFLKVGSGEVNDQLVGASIAKSKLASSTKTPEEDQKSYLKFVNEDFLLKGQKLVRNQVSAILNKKFIYMVRKWRLHLLMILFPAIFIMITEIGFNSSVIQDNLKLKLDMNTYGQPITLLTADNLENKYYVAAKRWLNQYELEVDDRKIKNFRRQIVFLLKKDTALTNRKYMVASDFEGNESFTNIVAYYNNLAYHTPPIALSFAINVAMKANNLPHNLVMYNQPLPPDIEAILKRTSFDADTIAMGLTLGMSLLTAFFAQFYIRERSNKIKQLQLISGLKVKTYWFVSLAWDYMIYLCTVFCVIITFLIINMEGLRTVDDLGRFLLISLVFGLTVVAIVPLYSFLFNIPSIGFIVVLIITFCFGCLLILAVNVMNLFNLDSLLGEDVLSMFPQYAYNVALKRIVLESIRIKVCSRNMDNCNRYSDSRSCEKKICDAAAKCCIAQESYFSLGPEGALLSILAMLGVVVLMFLLLIIIESKILRRCSLRKVKPLDSDFYDSDVKVERNRIDILTKDALQKETVLLRHVCKQFHRNMVVNDVTVSIKQTDCFGIFGLNNAGKSTTFKMMTGLIRPTYGDIIIKGCDISTQQQKLFKTIGYCPQDAAVIKYFTFRETLTFFSLIRGFSYPDSCYLVRQLANELSFIKQLDKFPRELSLCNKRKLCLAIAVIGYPSIICLDEPTAGIDPEGKRSFWRTLNTIRKHDKCIIFTSKDLAECEALSTRMTIMIDGMMRCLGTVQHLKEKYGNGYLIRIKMEVVYDDDDVTDIVHYIQRRLPELQLREMYNEVLVFFIIKDIHKLSKLFKTMEEIKNTFAIEEYSIEHCSLEHVYKNIMKLQKRISFV